ncbi:hypothetical protein [Sphingomonas sp.]|uniref:hypothetical protein n=1 Tax=Sphingomonas sp. TaxID=28214 RepID=UPI00286DC2C0|nr:hypothetical protein [Sphingomonas sp.]
MRVTIALAACALVAAAPPEPAKPLFTSADTLRLTIRGPVTAFAKGNVEADEERDATLTVAGGETLAVRLAPRGITRLRRDVCQFPPLRVVLVQPAPANSLFAGQRKLKLVTHCRAPAAFQQHLLLEYAAYRMYNLITPASLKARLAAIDYVGADGRPMTSRLGFFLEDPDDAARRLGLREVQAGDRIPSASLSAPHAARSALFQYMIGNLDWSMRAGPVGESCCHNYKLAGETRAPAGVLVPMPYDFDFSGLVDAPYALPPDQIQVSNVRERRYRGYCKHNGEAFRAAGELRALRGALLGELDRVPGLEPGTRRKAAAFLAGFFAEIANDATVSAKLLKTCVN